MKYNVELRDCYHELYRDNQAYYITSNDFSFIGDDNDSESTIETNCYRLAEKFKAISKDGTQITIEVCTYNTISSTWMQLYSLYYNEKRFIKH